jgi:hypothetical protein
VNNVGIMFPVRGITYCQNYVSCKRDKILPEFGKLNFYIIVRLLCTVPVMSAKLTCSFSKIPVEGTVRIIMGVFTFSCSPFENNAYSDYSKSLGENPPTGGGGG